MNTTDIINFVSELDLYDPKSMSKYGFEPLPITKPTELSTNPDIICKLQNIMEHDMKIISEQNVKRQIATDTYLKNKSPKTKNNYDAVALECCYCLQIQSRRLNDIIKMIQDL